MSSPTCHEFALVVDRHPDEKDWDWLADVTPDAGWTVPTDGGPAFAEFDRPARDLASAIGSAIRDLTTAGFRTVEVRPVLMLFDVEVCDRVGLSWPAINAQVEQSAVVHSKPMRDHVGRYSWVELAQWLTAHGVPQSYDQTIEVADRLLKGGTGAAWMGGEEIADKIRRGVRKMNPWKMPEWMEPYRSFIGETGGNTVEDLMDRLDLEPRIAITNLPVAMLGLAVRAQVHLLMRLHADGSLPAKPNADGGWGR